jgi:hypothetical protein
MFLIGLLQVVSTEIVVGVARLQHGVRNDQEWATGITARLTVNVKGSTRLTGRVRIQRQNAVVV